MAFPINPSPGDTYTDDYGTVWVYAGLVNGWYRKEVIPGNETTYTGGGGGSATATGNAGEIQYTDGTNLAASPNLLWDNANDELEIGGDIVLDDGGTYTTTIQCVTPTVTNKTISFPDATGTVALVAGSSGQLTYNNAGAQAGLTSANIGSTGAIDISLAGAASTPPVKFTGSWFTGTAVTAKPQLLIEPTGTTSAGWSPDGTGLGVNAASGFGGNLLDLQVNGTSQLKVSSDINVGIVANGSVSLAGTVFAARRTTGAVGLYSGGSFGFSSVGGVLGNTLTLDTALVRATAGVFKVTNGSTGTGYIKQDPVLTANLPNAATVGAGTRGFVSDASVTTFRGDPTPGTGTPSAATTVPVYSDGSTWLIG